MAGNHFFGALRIDGFMPADAFRKALDEAIREYRPYPRQSVSIEFICPVR